jgi:hypothetical protein
MPFTAWCAPNPKGLRLRTISRYIDSLTVQNAVGMNRLHAAEGFSSTPRCVIQDLKRSLVSTEQRIRRLRREAMTPVREDDELRQRYALLTSIAGIAQISAIQLLGELCTLSPDMSVREWVAHSGLDPAHEISGTSVRKQSRISRAGNRHLRRVLYMPALVASRCDPHMRAFYETLLARHKNATSGIGRSSKKASSCHLRCSSFEDSIRRAQTLPTDFRAENVKKGYGSYHRAKLGLLPVRFAMADRWAA